MKSKEHPGVYLEKIYRGFSTKIALAEKLGISRPTLDALMEGKTRLKPSMAAVLGDLHKGTAFWIGKQAAFDLWLAESRR
jgi:plasmid maintenance system antidote protein VapI